MPPIQQFSNARVYRFNHIPRYGDTVDTTFHTWALNYAHSGQISYSAEGGEERTLEGPVAFWTWPGPHWCYRPGKAGYWDHYFVSWRGKRAEEWQKNHLHPVCPPNEAFRLITEPESFRQRFSQLLTLLSERQPDDAEVIHELEGLLLQVHLQPKKRCQTVGLVMKVRELIEAVRENPGRNWDFPEQISQLGCTPVHFRRIWKKETGSTPTYFLQKARVNRAAALLRTQEYNIDEISQIVGYESQGYLSRLFIREHQMTPRDYRKAFQSVQ